MPSFAAILPAAGQSRRFGASRNKLYELLDGRPVLAWSAAAFLSRDDVAALIVPTSDPAAAESAIASNDPRLHFCPGGQSRAHSVRCALSAVDPSIEWVAVHDAARPLLSPAIIDRTLAAAVIHGAAVPAMPVALTIKEAQGPLPARIQRTIPRHTLFAMQTPQIMRRAALEQAFANCPIPLDQVTDDVQLLELIGQEAWLVDGEERNLKITTSLDLRIAELLVASR